MAGRRYAVALRVTIAGYECADDEAQKQHDKLPIGQIVGAEIARSRSLQQHRFYWSVLTRVLSDGPHEKVDSWRTPEAFHEALKVATGHVEIVQLVSGRLIKIPQRTGFDSMPQDEWQKFMGAVFKVIEEEIIGMSIDVFMATAEQAA